MRKLAIGVLLALLAMVSSALADADGNRLNQLGFLGLWKVDCNAPASDTNPAQLFAAPASSNPTRALQTTEGFKVTHKLRDVQTMADNRISMIWTNLNNGNALRIVLLRDGNRHKGYESVELRGGKMLVKDGRFLSSGKETPWFTKCGTK